MKKILFSLDVFYTGLQAHSKTVIPAWVPYDETEEVAKLLPMHPQNAIQSYPIKNSR
jgi:hypothetical protein